MKRNFHTKGSEFSFWTLVFPLGTIYRDDDPTPTLIKKTGSLSNKILLNGHFWPFYLTFHVFLPLLAFSLRLTIDRPRQLCHITAKYLNKMPKVTAYDFSRFSF